MATRYFTRATFDFLKDLEENNDRAWFQDADGMGLSFTPTQTLDPSTRYTIHVGGGMTDTDGGIINLDLNGPALGGTWVTLEMVTGMTAMGMGPSHSGPQWLSLNGMYGLAFAFTTRP